jgi:hypothetical protein
MSVPEKTGTQNLRMSVKTGKNHSKNMNFRKKKEKSFNKAQ